MNRILSLLLSLVLCSPAISQGPVIDLSAVRSDASSYAPIFSDLIGAPIMLMQTGRCGYMYGTGSDVVAASKTIRGGTIRPGCLLKSTMLIGKYSPHNGGGVARIKIRQGANSVTIADASTNATAALQSYDSEIYLSADGKWGYAKGSSNINFFNDNATDLASSTTPPTYYSLSGSFNTPNGLPNPRLQSNIAFATYSSPPTTETVLIDWSQDVTIDVVHRTPTTDRIELQGFTLMMYAPPRGSFYANPKLTICAGDSLTEGSGSTLTGAGSNIPNDWVSQLGRIRTGTPFINIGLGGQKITQIVDRILADPINGKYARIILWAGVNDITDDADVVNTVKTQIDRLIAFRRSPSNPTGRNNLIICTLTPNTTWTIGQTYYTRLTGVNTMLKADYSANVCDLFEVITAGSSNPGFPDPADLADVIHHDNSGYAKDASGIDATMTAFSWAP